MASTKLCRHQRRLCVECIEPDDAARRAYDIINQIVANLGWSDRQSMPYVALRLSDGGSDGKNYVSFKEAVKYQLHESQCAYYSFRGMPNGFRSLKDAAIFLAWARATYDAGMKFVDPDDKNGGGQVIMPDSVEHLQNQFTRISQLVGLKDRRYG